MAEALAEIERLKARVVELEAAAALRHGSLREPAPSETVSFTWGVAPNAPGHEMSNVKQED